MDTQPALSRASIKRTGSPWTSPNEHGTKVDEFVGEELEGGPRRLLRHHHLQEVTLCITAWPLSDSWMAAC